MVILFHTMFATLHEDLSFSFSGGERQPVYVYNDDELTRANLSIKVHEKLTIYDALLMSDKDDDYTYDPINSNKEVYDLMLKSYRGERIDNFELVIFLASIDAWYTKMAVEYIVDEYMSQMFDALDTHIGAQLASVLINYIANTDRVPAKLSESRAKLLFKYVPQPPKKFVNIVANAYWISYQTKMELGIYSDFVLYQYCTNSSTLDNETALAAMRASRRPGSFFRSMTKCGGVQLPYSELEKVLDFMTEYRDVEFLVRRTDLPQIFVDRILSILINLKNKHKLSNDAWMFVLKHGAKLDFDAILKSVHEMFVI